MVPAVLSRASSYLTNPQHFAIAGSIASLTYTFINCYKIKSDKIKNDNEPYAITHIVSFISQANLSFLALIMWKNPLVQKVSTYMASNLTPKILPSARFLILTPILLTAVDLGLHMAQNSSSLSNYEYNIENIRKKIICGANFVISAAYLAAFALTAFSHFENWKKDLISGALWAGVTYLVLDPIGSWLEKKTTDIGTTDISAATFIITPAISITISLIASRVFPSLSSAPKAMTLCTIIGHNVLSILLKSIDCFE